MQKYVNGVKMAKKYLQLRIVLKTITVNNLSFVENIFKKYLKMGVVGNKLMGQGN